MAPVTAHEEARSVIARPRSRGYFALYKFMWQNWGSTILRVVDGRLTMHGLGDGGNDVDELATSSECIAVISALFAGTFYSPLEQASSKATVIEANQPGIGILTFWAAYTTFWAWSITVTFAVFLLMFIRNIPTQPESTYFISIASKEIRAPTLCLIFSICCSVWTVFMDVFTRMAQLDQPQDLASTLEGVNFTEAASSIGRQLMIIKAKSDQQDGEVAGTGSRFASSPPVVAAFAIQIPFWFGLFILWLFSTVHKLLHARRIFSAEDSPAATKESLERMPSTPAVPWLATPSADKLRLYLDQYLKIFGARGSLGMVISPEHFREYVVHLERKAGHGDISYFARRMIDQILEQWVQEELMRQNVKIDAEDLLVDADTLETQEESPTMLKRNSTKSMKPSLVRETESRSLTIDPG